MEFILEDISDAEVQRRRAVYEPLTDSVRGLVDAVIRTEVDEDVIAAARRQVDDVVAMLRERQTNGSYGVRYTKSGIGLPLGNAVIGGKNAIAPPLVVHRDEAGVARAEVTLGAAYEGPSGCAHGGVVAMLLDHVLGDASSADGDPCVTGTISVRYLQPTRLGVVRLEAAVDHRTGRKKIIRGTLSTDDGVTAEAEGIFIVPREYAGEVPTHSAHTAGADVG